MRKRVGIVGYRMGNVMSLRHAFEAIGADVFIGENPAQLQEATHLVLPGVGAFPMAMDNLESLGFRSALDHLVNNEKRPLLGICLGMQLLATDGEEHRLCKGLGYIPGHVKRLDVGELRVPHMGWNDTYAVKPNSLLRSDEKKACFYFVHSFYLIPDDSEDISMRCEYGGSFAAGVQRGLIYGVQFHPEKSHDAGLGVLKQFMEVEQGVEAKVNPVPVFTERADRP